MTVNKLWTRLTLILLMFSLLSCSSDVELTLDSELQQAVFDTPVQAAEIFTKAVSNRDSEILGQLLGANYQTLFPVDTIADEDIANYMAAWDKSHSLTVIDDRTQYITIGEDQWTLPVPLVLNDKQKWYFDSQQGVSIMTLRRIGQNELLAIQALMTYYHAQKEYAATDHDKDGKLEFAQELFSHSNTEDGLIWPGNNQKYAMQLASILSEREEDGSYHGYKYKVLHSQQLDTSHHQYVIDGAMTEGFAAIAWPVEYGETGIMSFLISENGVLFEKDLGQETANIVEQLKSYESSNWLPTDADNITPIN